MKDFYCIPELTRDEAGKLKGGYKAITDLGSSGPGNGGKPNPGYKNYNCFGSANLTGGPTVAENRNCYATCSCK